MTGLDWRGYSGFISQRVRFMLHPKAFILKRYIMHPNVNSHYTEDPKTN